MYINLFLDLLSVVIDECLEAYGQVDKFEELDR